MNLVEQLQKRLTGDVATDEATRKEHNHDTSLFEITPEIVVAPKNIADVQAVVSLVGQSPDAAITARSGGTCMSGGAIGESVIMDFKKYLNTIHQVTGEHATAEPGALYRDFEQKTLARNRIMPSYPASREICCIGGMVANNAGGERTLKYGKTIDFVEELEVVLSDGEVCECKPLTREELEMKKEQRNLEGRIYREMEKLIVENYELIHNARPNVSKNSAGYNLWEVWDKENDTFDLTKLIVGSQGTLALVTKATFRLVRPERHSQMMIVFLDSLDAIGEVVETVLKHEPATFESYDDKTLRLAVKLFWDFVKRLGVRNLFYLAINSLGEFKAILRGGFPKMVLQITFRGDDEEALHKKAVELQKELAAFSPQYSEIIESDLEAEQYWLIRRESFNLLRHKVKGRKTAPFVDDISIRPEHIAEVFPKLNAIFEEYEDKMIYNIAGHIGDGNFHIIPLMDLSDPKSRDIIPEVAQRVYDVVLEYDGSITGEHNDGIIRTPFLKAQFGDEVYALFEKTKNIFDPQHIFNPGKKVPSTRAIHSEHTGGTLEYAVEHMKTHN